VPPRCRQEVSYLLTSQRVDMQRIWRQKVVCIPAAAEPHAEFSARGCTIKFNKVGEAQEHLAGNRAARHETCRCVEVPQAQRRDMLEPRPLSTDELRDGAGAP